MEIFRKKAQVTLRIDALAKEKNGAGNQLTKVAMLSFVRKFLSYLLFLVLLLWIAISFRHNSVFPIKKVRIEGAFLHLDPKLVRNIVSQHIGAGFFGLNAMVLSDRLMVLPWLYNVSVQRVWPDELLVFLEEQHPLVIWNNVALFNNDGVLFFPEAKNFPHNLPKIIAANLDAKIAFNTYLTMSRALAPLNLNVTEIFIDAYNAWRLTLNNGLIIFLGRNDALARLQLFVTTYPKIIANPKKKPLQVDLRYNHGFAVSWES